MPDGEMSTAQSESPPSTPELPPQPAQAQPVNILCSRGFPDWLLRNKLSIAFTSYQTGRLYLVGVNQEGKMSFHERFLARAMGLWTDPQRLVLSTLFQVWRFEHRAADAE
jgi:uncharacterized protein (TIGR03032 family)